jgi:CheY-like chemotaxis protein
MIEGFEKSYFLVNYLSNFDLYGIMKLLIVDDKKENIKAAVQFFEKIGGLHVDYAYSASEAIKIIKKKYPSDRYDIVITDLEMEEQHSGMNVAREALAHQTFCVIATGKSATGHGDNITVKPGNNPFPGLKSDVSVWEKIYASALEQYRAHDTLRAAFNRYLQYNGKPDYKSGDLALNKYS